MAINELLVRPTEQDSWQPVLASRAKARDASMISLQ
jgi:hypothetical protein